LDIEVEEDEVDQELDNENAMVNMFTAERREEIENRLEWTWDVGYTKGENTLYGSEV